MLQGFMACVSHRNDFEAQSVNDRTRDLFSGITHNVSKRVSGDLQQAWISKHSRGPQFIIPSIERLQYWATPEYLVFKCDILCGPTYLADIPIMEMRHGFPVVYCCIGVLLTLLGWSKRQVVGVTLVKMEIYLMHSGTDSSGEDSWTIEQKSGK